MIELKDVSKIYRRASGEVRALDGLDLRVERGEFVVIEGPSGSGKTTLLFTAAGLIRPTAGKVIVDGVELTGRGPAELARLRRKKFGFVFQMFHLIPYLSALENVCVPMGLAGVPPEEAAGRARALLSRFGLSTRADHYPAELSAGERQRVAISRAVANRPPIILADEPTGNLDPKAAADVFTALQEIHREGTSIMVVTHDERISKEATRLLRLESGKAVGPGTAEGSRP